MEEIVCVENEVILSILEKELSDLDIQYLVKKMDIPNLLTSKYINVHAIIFSDKKNWQIIIEAYNNIKESQKQENNIESDGRNTAFKKVAKIMIVVIVVVMALFIIVVQQMVIRDFTNFSSVVEETYVYKWSPNHRELDSFLKKNNYHLSTSIDNDRNGVFEISKIYYPNDTVSIGEDTNQNSFYEKETLMKNGIVLKESISTNDNGIFDITYYYMDGKVNKKVTYDIENNEISIE